MKRRQFLQFAASTLTTLGLSDIDLRQWGDRYAQVLAQSTPRKLALLVGIDAYDRRFGWSTLNGCLTDVELQRQLLVHRFGFHPSDILTLTDHDATRDGILTAFESHLIQQAKPGDVVVFHYSGHGSRVLDPDAPPTLNSTLVPIDSPLPSDYPDRPGSVNDIMGRTLFLLMSALQTEWVTVVLDSCYSGGGKRGNLTIRARDGGGSLQPSDAELAYQNQWLTRLHLTPEEFRQQRQAAIARGVVITSAGENQYAADVPFDGFSAGAFTYLMTRYLWQQTRPDPVTQVVANLSRSTQVMAQQSSRIIQSPEVETHLPHTTDTPPLYFVAETPPIAADGVIQRVYPPRAELWLGGIDSQGIVGLGAGARLAIVAADGTDHHQVQLLRREGLWAEAELLEAETSADFQPGAFLQEQVRTIPPDLSLRIGLDPSLGDELTIAHESLQGFDRVEALPLGEGDVQYILIRMTPLYEIQMAEVDVPDRPRVGQVGLCSPGLDPLPGSFGAIGESVTDAVTRLAAKLRSLLAARVIKTLVNLDASRLNISVSLRPIDGNSDSSGAIVGQAFTVRGQSPSNPSSVSPQPTTPLPQLTVGTAIQFQIANQDVQDLYVSLLVIDPTGEMAVIFPNDWSAAADAALVLAGEPLWVPSSADAFQLTLRPPLGYHEVLAIASSDPLRTALTALQTLADSESSRGPIALRQASVDVVDHLVADLTGRDRRGGTDDATPPGIDVNRVAALSMSFEVVAEQS